MYRIVTLVFVCTFALVMPAYSEDSGIAKIFKDRNIIGTIVLSSLDGKIIYTHNDERAQTRFVPASTFKIPNTLIALEESAISDEHEIIVWDGTDKGLAIWNQDQTLETAFQSSCVWFYQELAKRVGKDKYTMFLHKMKYGNEQIGPEITTFWLEGDLKISANGQIAFLRQFYAKEFPFKSSSYALLKKLMVVEKTPTYKIIAKSGWAQGIIPQVGWFVGYVESAGTVWFFAMNMVIAKPEDSRFRQEVVVEALRLKGII